MIADVEKNMEAREIPSQDQDGLAGDVNESLGMTDEQPQISEEPSQGDGAHSNESLAVQKRLKAQRRAHDRETRDLHARIADLENRMSQPNMNSQDQPVNPYNVPQGNDIDGHIHKAVVMALQHKEMEERKARDAQSQAHVNRQYQEFQKHLDNVGDKYDDFHDVVYGRDTPYTTSMRDYALTLPRNGAGSAGEVLYKLGKNQDELKRISNLHPLDQASEMSRLSHALISGGESKNANSRPLLGNIKNNPVVNSHSVTEKTSVSDLRKRMKAGWK